MLRIDHRRHGIERGAREEELVEKEVCGDRPRIGEAARLHHDRVEPAGPRQEPMRDAHEIAAHGAADAAIVELEQFLVALDDQIVVDADRAELVDDHGIAQPVILREDAVQKRGLAGAQMAGQHRDGNPLRSFPRQQRGVDHVLARPWPPTERMARSTSFSPKRVRRHLLEREAVARQAAPAPARTPCSCGRARS